MHSIKYSLLLVVPLVMLQGCTVFHQQIAEIKTTKISKRDSGEPQFPIRGQGKCAHCEYNLHPIGDSDSDGLAIKTEDGSIFIVEYAEANYEDLFKERFDDVYLELDGAVVKKQGSIFWVEPVSLRKVSKEKSQQDRTSPPFLNSIFQTKVKKTDKDDCDL